jgi:hypothetical protein
MKGGFSPAGFARWREGEPLARTDDAVAELPDSRVWYMTYSRHPRDAVHLAWDGAAKTSCGIWANGTKHDPTTFGDVAKRLCPQCAEAWRVFLTVVAKPASELGSQARRAVRKDRARARARRK